MNWPTFVFVVISALSSGLTIFWVWWFTQRPRVEIVEMKQCVMCRRRVEEIDRSGWCFDCFSGLGV